MRKIFGFLLMMFVVHFSFAQSENTFFKSDSITIKKIADDVMANGGAYENLRFLCKKVGPRLSGSDNAAKAILATKKMLEDAGADTVYLQPCMVTHWVRGEKEEGYTLIDGKKLSLKMTSLGNSEGSKIGRAHV